MDHVEARRGFKQLDCEREATADCRERVKERDALAASVAGVPDGTRSIGYDARSHKYLAKTKSGPAPKKKKPNAKTKR